jgi:hypothetical protein
MLDSTEYSLLIRITSMFKYLSSQSLDATNAEVRQRRAPSTCTAHDGVDWKAIIDYAKYVVGRGITIEQISMTVSKVKSNFSLWSTLPRFTQLQHCAMVVPIRST